MTEADGIPYSMGEKVVAALLTVGHSLRLERQPFGDVDSNDVMDLYEFYLLAGRQTDDPA